MPYLKERWDKLSPKVQNAIQAAVGILLAAGCGFFLLRGSDQDNSFFSLLCAAGLVLLVPKVCETQTGAKWPLMRRVMLITLVVVLIAMGIYAFTQGASFFAK